MGLLLKWIEYDFNGDNLVKFFFPPFRKKSILKEANSFLLAKIHFQKGLDMQGGKQKVIKCRKIYQMYPVFLEGCHDMLLNMTCPVLANSIDSGQLASSEAN